MLNEAFAQRKLSPEALTDLTRTRIWQTNNFSRFNYDASALSGEELWTILSIHPEPTLTSPGVITPVANDVSLVRLDLAFKSSDYSAKRLTYEQWSLNTKNPFLPGNSLLTNGFKEYSYLDPSTYSGTNYTPAREYEIRPAVNKKFIGVRYLKRPTPVSLVSDNVEFPATVLNLVVDQALQFISFKQGDGTNLYAVSTRDMDSLIALFR